MEEFVIVGYENVNYKSKKTGNQVEGVRIYLHYLSENVFGFGCESIFVKSELFDGLGIDDTIELSYNKYGNISKITKIK